MMNVCSLLQRLIYAAALSVAVSLSAQAARVDTVQVYSPSMQKKVEVIVVVPDKTSSLASSVYLLHGYSGNARSWIDMRPDLPDVADRYNLLFICPDGKNSWYWDSPVNPSMRYETFVAKELVAFVQSEYQVADSPTQRAISGLSMGGHGALWVGMRHPDVFGAAGSMSGGLDIRPFPDSWEMKKQLGERKEYPERWKQHAVIHQLETMENGKPHLIIDCGVDDFFYAVNEATHRRLLERKIAHDYIIRPGEHNAAYWKNSLDYQLLFFIKHFEKR